MKAILLLAGLLAFCFLQGQQITGKVHDAVSGRPLENVNIHFPGTNQGLTTNEKGGFSVRLPQPGKYQIRVSMVGYQKFEKEIIVNPDTTIHLTINLQPFSTILYPEIVITARRVESDQFDVPEAITVVSTERLRQESSRSTPEALHGMAGVFVQKTNHGGGSPIIRGMIGNQNLLLIDGIRLNNSTFRYGPNQYLSTVDPMAVQRIEVVRGAGSVLYGSDALGGAVQVISKESQFSPAGCRVNAGLTGKWVSHEMENTGRAEISLSDTKIAFTGGFTYNDFGNNHAGKGIEEQDPTGYKSKAADTKIKMKLNDKNELVLAYQYHRQDDVPRYDQILAGYKQYHFDPQIRNLGYAKLRSSLANKWYSSINLTAFYSNSDEKRILQKTGQAKITEEHDVVNTYGGLIEVNSNPRADWNFISGIDYYFDKVGSTKAEFTSDTVYLRGYYPDGASSASLALFSSHTLKVSAFDFVLGGRFSLYRIKIEDPLFEDVDLKPTSFIGSASVIYNLQGHHKIIASVYSAFRAPNINDLSSFGTFNYGIEVPNPSLDPEKSLTTEIGIKSRYQCVSGSIFIYNNQLTNRIDRVAATWNNQDSIDGAKVHQKRNFSEAYTRGVEAELRYDPVSWLSVYGNLTYTFGQNKTADEPLSRIPPLHGGMVFSFKTNQGFWSNVEWYSAEKQDRLSSGDKKDTRIPQGGTPGWNVVHIRAGYSWKWIRVSTGLTNLFNEAYRTHGSGVHGAGRSFWISLNLSVS